MKDNAWMYAQCPSHMNNPLLLGRIVWHLVRQLGGQATIPAEALAETDDDNYRLTYSNLIERLDCKSAATFGGDLIYLESFDLRELDAYPDTDRVMEHGHPNRVCERALAFFEERTGKKI